MRHLFQPATRTPDAPVRGIRDAARLWGVRLSRMMTATTAGLLGVAALASLSAAPVQAQSLSGLNSPVSAPTDGTTDGPNSPNPYRHDHVASGQWFAAHHGASDLKTYQKSIAHRDQMPTSATIGGRAAHASGPLCAHSIGGASRWAFTGPNNYLNTGFNFGFGQGATAGRVDAVAYDPNTPTTFYSASAGGGVWKTTDNGATWKSLSDFLPADGIGDAWKALQTSSVTVDPKNSNIIYVGTGDFYDAFGTGSTVPGFGIMKSVDGGTHWKNITKSNVQADGSYSDLFGGTAVSKILVDPDNSNIVTASTGRALGGFGYLWRSADGGQTWSPAVTAGGSKLPLSLWSDVQVGLPNAQGQRYYYADATFSSDGTFGGLWRSSDKGVTWKKLFAPFTNGSESSSRYSQTITAPSATDPNTAYIVVSTFNETIGLPPAGVSKEKVYVTRNAGITYTDITGRLAQADFSQGFYDLYIQCISRPDKNGVAQDVLFVGTQDIFQYQGGQWNALTNVYYSTSPIYAGGQQFVHTDQHGFAQNPKNPNSFIVGNDGGTYHLDYNPANGTYTASSTNATMGITQFYNSGYDSNDPNIILAGAQDNGTAISRSDLSNWTLASGGDGAYCAIDPFRPNNMYSSSQGLSVYHSTDSFNSFGGIKPAIGTDNVAFIAPLVLDPIFTNFVYGGTDFIDRYDDTTGVWTTHLSNQRLVNHGKTPTPKDPFYVQTIAVAPSDSRLIYTGSSDGEVWFSNLAGNLNAANQSSWSERDAGLPGAPISSISINQTNSNDIVVGMTGYGFSHVWRSFDGGNSWSGVGGDPTDLNSLPDTQVNTIARDPYDPANIFYVGTDIGVFQTTDGGSTWTNATTPLGLPNVMVMDLKAMPGTGYLNAATYGRGVWRIPLTDTTGTGFVGVQSVTLTPSTVVGGTSLSGTVTLTAPAPVGGATVKLASGKPTLLQVPATVTIPAGATTATFGVNTSLAPAKTTVTVSATYNTTTKSAVETLLPVAVASLTVTPNPIGGGATGTGTVTLTNPAPMGGVIVALSSNTSAALTVPATVTIAAGQSSQTFPVTTSIVSVDTPVTVTASFNNTSQTASVTVLAPKLVSVSIVPTSIPATLGATGTVTLTGPAPKSGIVVTLSSDTPKVLQVPASVTVPSGQTTATFPVTTSFVNADTAVTVSAVFNGVTATTQVTVVTPKLSSFVVNPTTVLAGNSVTATVTLTGPAGPGGYRVNLSDDGFVNTGGFGGQNYFVHVPNSFGFFGQGRGYVIVPAGQTSVTFTITTSFVRTQTNVTITAQDATVTLNANLLVQAPLKSLTIAPTTIKGGYSVTGTIVFNVPDFFYPSDTVIVTSSNTNVATVVTTMPNRVTMLGGATVTKFSIATRKVTSTQTVTITANFGGTIITQNLTVTP